MTTIVVGQKIGALTMLERVGTRKRDALWRCLCECGKERLEVAAHLRSRRPMCICPRPPRIITMPDGSTAIEVPLTQGKVALLDPEDAHLATRKWFARRDHGTWYAHRRGPKSETPRRTFLLHREVLGAPPGLEVDHRDGNGLDNRRANLRVATHQQNQANRPALATNTSGFKGVRWHSQRKRWEARIRAPGGKRSLGFFDTAEEAARAHDAAAREIHGEFACVNFPLTGERPGRPAPSPSGAAGDACPKCGAARKPWWREKCPECLAVLPGAAGSSPSERSTT